MSLTPLIRLRSLPLLTLALALGLVSMGADCQQDSLTQSKVPRERDQALQLLKLNATSSNALRRVQSLEALAHTIGPDGAGFYNDALNDPLGPVRFAACMAIAHARTKDSLPLVRIRAGDADPTVRAAAIYAMHMLGDKSHTGELAGLLFHNDPRVRSQVCTVLGLMGEKGSIPLIRRGVQDEDVRVQWAAMEALARLGDKTVLVQMMNFATVGYADDRILAVLTIGETRYGKGIHILEGQLGADYQEVRLASARSLGMLGRMDGINETRLGLNTQTNLLPRPDMTRDETAQYNSAIRIRSMAAMAAGAIGDKSLLPDLKIRMDTDPDMQVRLAAATAILEIIDRGPQKGPEAYDTDAVLVPAVAPTPRPGQFGQPAPGQSGQDYGAPVDRRVTNPQPSKEQQPPMRANP